MFYTWLQQNITNRQQFCYSSYLKVHFGNDFLCSLCVLLHKIWSWLGKKKKKKDFSHIFICSLTNFSFEYLTRAREILPLHPQSVSPSCPVSAVSLVTVNNIYLSGFIFLTWQSKEMNLIRWCLYSGQQNFIAVSNLQSVCVLDCSLIS